MVAVKVVVEGGKAGANADAEFRESWSNLVKRALPGCRSPKFVAAGGRQDAYKTFLSLLAKHPDNFIILLVDSEDEIATTTSVWQHLSTRQDDIMERPPNVTDDHAHLMVRSMECWFLADRDALKSYFQKHFNENALPNNPNIEEIDRHTAYKSLQNAAKNTTKGTYHKTRDGFKLIGLIDPTKVRNVSSFAARFFEVLEQKLC